MTILANIMNCKAQVPTNDATFTLVAIDDFTGTAVNTSSWSNPPSWACAMSHAVVDPANVSVTGGYCKLKVEDLRPAGTNSCATTFYFRGGVLESKFKFKYGYYEISAKCPVGKGLHFGFWTLGDCTSGNYHEEDIIENSGAQSEPGNIMGTNYHWDPVCPNNGYATNPPDITVSNVADEHRYAMFWEPGKITWFYDDVPVAVNNPTAAVDPAYILLSIDTETNTIGGLSNVTATFPAYFQINYLKISQLIPDCNTAVSFCSNFNASTWNSASKVKKSITVGGSGCSDVINSSSNVNFWATDYVLLDEGVTINGDGSGSFMANTTGCPN